MEEFTSQTGGRYTYVDDFINLQELALVFGEVFTDCDNFIVSGCEVSGNAISAGIVYLNGKLRVVEATPTIIGGWPQYIYEVNEIKNVPYASGTEKVGRKKWGAKVGKTVPTAKTPLTDAAPKVIQINATGGLRMKDAWFGKYALLLNPAALEQSVQGTVNLQKLNVTGDIKSTSRYKITSAGREGSIYINGDNLVFDWILPTSQHVQMMFDGDSGATRFVINNKLIATVAENNIVFTKPLFVPEINVGNLKAIDSSISNTSTADDEGMLNINMFGYSGSDAYFRTTKIGDGKGLSLLTISGKEHTLRADGQVIISACVDSPLIIRAQFAKENNAIIQFIEWQDLQKQTMASFGYTSDTDTNFVLTNDIGNVMIKGSGCVDISPAIKENGVLLSEKYVLVSNLSSLLNQKIDIKDVYTKSESYNTDECNQIFAKQANGFSQFITDKNTAETLCKQIGALREVDLNNYVKKNMYLQDMADTQSAKQQIRENIGAAAILTDTGWVRCGTLDMYARQIGHIVCIQGYIHAIERGTIFTLPNNISSPSGPVAYTAPVAHPNFFQKGWGCVIEPSSRECVVVEGSWDTGVVPVSIIYMI